MGFGRLMMVTSGTLSMIAAVRNFTRVLNNAPPKTWQLLRGPDHRRVLVRKPAGGGGARSFALRRARSSTPPRYASYQGEY